MGEESAAAPMGSVGVDGVSRGNVAPVMNDYKLAFFWRRWTSTLAGGARVLLSGGNCVPLRAHAMQIALFAAPPAIAIGATIAMEGSAAAATAASGIVAAIAGGACVGMHDFGTVIERQPIGSRFLITYAA